MSVNVVSLFRPKRQSYDWNNQELAEFYRVEASLVRGDVPLETERGLSDEGDPWFVFCHRETGDVIIHFARIDGYYIVASPALDTCARGREFRPLIESLLKSHPVVVPKSTSNGKLVIHPAALLVALVTICFFKLGHSDAYAADVNQSIRAMESPSSAKGDPSGAQAIVLNEKATSALLGVIASATAWSIDNNDGHSYFVAPPPVSESETASLAVLPSLDNTAAFDTNASVAGRSQASAAASFDAAVADGSVSSTASSARSPDAAGLQILVPQKVVALDNLTIALHHDPAPPLVHSVIPAAIVAQNAPSATETSASNGGAGSAASSEVGLVLGASVQTHVVTDLSGAEQKFVENVAPAPVATPASSSVGSPSGVHVTTTTTASAESVSPISVAAAPSTVSLSVSTSNVAVADAAIQQFVGSHPDFQLLTLGSELVLYDPHLTPANVSASFQETLTFSDGSSVFLIGLPATSHATA